MAAIAVTLTHPTVSTTDQVAGGSGDSPTNGVYTQPSVPAMSLDPSNQKVGSTMTMSTPAPTLATALASPTFKATAAPGCVNNGQCP
jgi:hypothetical protein